MEILGVCFGMKLVVCLTVILTWTGVLVVTDVLVSSSSVVTECFAGVSWDSDWEFVEPQAFFSLQQASDRLCGVS